MTDNRENYYRRQAKDAQAHANRAIRADDRAAWLRLARGWLELIAWKPSTDASEAFDDAVQEHGTHQDISQNEQ